MTCQACAEAPRNQPRVWAYFAGSCEGCAARIAAMRATQRMRDGIDRERAISDAARLFRVNRQEVDRWLTS